MNALSSDLFQTQEMYLNSFLLRSPKRKTVGQIGLSRLGSMTSEGETPGLLFERISGTLEDHSFVMRSSKFMAGWYVHVCVCVEVNNGKEPDSIAKKWKTKQSKVMNLLWKNVDIIMFQLKKNIIWTIEIRIPSAVRLSICLWSYNTRYPHFYSPDDGLLKPKHYCVDILSQ